MRFKISPLLLLIGVSAITACKKSNPTPSTQTIKMDTDVYVSGYIVADNGNSVAAYWKNGFLNKLTDSSVQSQATGICAKGTDVYISGVTNLGGNAKAVYWKNGMLTELTNASTDASTSGVAVNGNDIYISGYQFDSGHSTAAYWKNGVLQLLKGNSGDTFSSGIALSGNDVYVIGSSLSASGHNSATYWKNNTTVSLTDGLSNSNASGIAINGSDVYISGSTTGAVYWKNGSPIMLATSGSASSITTNGNDIYVAGRAPLKIGYWKNGNITDLTDGSKTIEVNCIAVQGNNVYVSGMEYDNNNKAILVVYWKNGKMFNLQANTTKLNGTNGIAVVVHPAN
jgi:hypothetical protein